MTRYTLRKMTSRRLLESVMTTDSFKSCWFFLNSNSLTSINECSARDEVWRQNKLLNASDTKLFFVFQHTWQLRKTFYQRVWRYFKFMMNVSVSDRISQNTSCRPISNRNSFRFPDHSHVFSAIMVTESDHTCVGSRTDSLFDRTIHLHFLSVRKMKRKKKSMNVRKKLEVSMESDYIL